MDSGAEKEPLYMQVRGLHLALTAAIVPCALWGFLEKHPGGNALVAGGAWLVCVFVLLFLIPLDQARYPLGLVPALYRTVPMVLNLGWALISEGEVKSAAFFSGTALLAGLAVLLLAGVAIELRRKAGEGESKERRRLAASMLLPLAVLMGLASAFTLPMLISMIRSESPVAAAASAALWLLNVAGVAQAWFRESTWSNPAVGEGNPEFGPPWPSLSAAAFTVGFLGVTVVAIWKGLAG